MTINLVSTFWFLIGGIRDMRQLFIDLKNRVADDNDKGQVLNGDSKPDTK